MITTYIKQENRITLLSYRVFFYMNSLLNMPFSWGLSAVTGLTSQFDPCNNKFGVLVQVILTTILELTLHGLGMSLSLSHFGCWAVFMFSKASLDLLYH